MLLLIAVLLLAALGWKGWQIYAAAQAVRQDVQALEATLAMTSNTERMDRLEALLPRTRAHMQRLRDEAALFFPVLPILGDVPTYGPTLAAAEPLLDAGVQLTTVADESFTALAPAIEAYQSAPTAANLPLLHALIDAGPELDAAQAAFEQAQSSWQDIPVTHLVPRLRTQVERMDTLLPVVETGLASAEAAHELAHVAVPILARSEESLGNRVGVALAEQRAHIAAAQQALARADEAMAHVDAATLPPPLRGQVSTVVALLPDIQRTLDLALIAPDMLGVHTPRTYLLLLQNPDELRPTGGFITGVGTLTLEDGRLVSYEVGDSGLYDDLENSGIYPSPPGPLGRYMGLGIWVLRDANWSPDFPTTAAVAESLYRLTQHQDVDGVVALTPTAFELLLGVLGPLPIEGEAQPITAETITDYLQTAWSPKQAINAAWSERKSNYLNRIAVALEARINAGIEPAQLPELAGMLQQMLDERHLLIASFAHQEDRVLAQQGWNGAVRPGEGDFLMVVDANVGYNKANARISQSMTYTVDLSTPAVPRAHLAVQHTHQNPDPQPCEVAFAFTEGNYDTMTRGCYWNYLRVLVPSGSQLLADYTPPVPAAWIYNSDADDGITTIRAEPGNSISFGRLIVVPSGDSHTTSLEYRLPAHIAHWEGNRLHYRLHIQKQAGREAIPAHIQVQAPPQSTLIASSQPVSEQTDRVYRFEMPLSHDKTLALVFEVAE
jgi:hypothetical protein